MKHPEFDDGPSPRRFSTGELVAAAIGGVAVGALTVALWPKRAAVPVRAVLPSGAVASQPSDARLNVRIPTRPVLIEPPHGTPINPRMKATAQLWAKPPKGLIQGPMRKFATADALLRSCPTQAEMEQIRSDFNIFFAPGVATTWSCTEGGSESSAMLTVYNLFRLFYSMDFDAPIPIIGATNAYQWLRSMNLNWYFRPSAPGDLYNNAGGHDVVLNSDNFAAPGMRTVFDPRGGVSMGGMHGLIVHEARHTDPGGAKFHACSVLPGNMPGSADSSLSYEGAYGLEYYFTQWLAEHSGSFWSPDQKAVYAAWLDTYRGPGGRFCDEFHPALRGDELDPHFWWNWLGWLDRQRGPLNPSIQRAWAGLSPLQRMNQIGINLSGHIPFAMKPSDFPYHDTSGVKNDTTDLDAERRVTALASNHGALRAISMVTDAISTNTDRPAQPQVAIPQPVARPTASNVMPVRPR